MTTLLPIPSPPSIPLLGHINTIDPLNSQRSFRALCQTYGEIYSLNFFGRKVVVVSTEELVNELCDEKRFYKKIDGALEEVRHGVGDGLFTAYHGEENWGPAHRILMPAFGPGQIRDMFSDMLDINSQLLFKWERFGPDHPIDPSEDFTRLAFDTISLCAMSYRLNSFYHTELPPFITAMGSFLTESGARAQRPHVLQSWMSKANAKYEADIKVMTDICDELIAHRKAHPSDRKDLLGLMLEGKDPKTGQHLSDQNIRYQLMTFLIAGHETTSGLLTFATYYLLSTPRAYLSLQHEIDSVLGSSPIQLSHLSQLSYTAAVLRETLRLNPPVSVLRVAGFEQEVIGGRYGVGKGETVMVDIPGLHRDPKVWGDDVEVFRPERMLDGKFEALPPNSWKPFGNGARGCIGRPFAWQEALMMLATLFQKFDLRFDDPAYQLQVKQTLTVKPAGLRIHAIPREGRLIATVGSAGSVHAGAHGGEGKKAEGKIGGDEKAGTPLYVLFGSNSGSCEGFAQSVASDAASHGFKATIATLDSVEKKMPTDGPIVILTASYEGQPADNAARFVEWLTGTTAAPPALKGVKFVVFGAGHHDWVQTYQRIPTMIDATMEERGGERLMQRFAADAGGADFFGEFDKWEHMFWEVLEKAYGTSATGNVQPEDDLVVTVTGTARTIYLRQPDLSIGRVVENRVLTSPQATGQKRHIEFELPAAMEYRAGDYLAILPVNPKQSVRRVLDHFKLHADTKIAIKSKGPTTLPTDEPISYFELFSQYVELGQPATKRNFDEILQYAPKEGKEADQLKVLAVNAKTEVFDKRLSVLDILELYPSIDLPLSQFIKMQPSMRIRQYSISSSPLWKPGHCTLTISVVRAPSSTGHGEFLGVSSNYLANLEVGDTVNLAVRPSPAGFHLPTDNAKPIVMFCAGSGFSPMRGFIQDRAEQIAAGREVGKALLFVGCRAPEEDFLYADAELAQWIAAGAVDVRPAFSKMPEASAGCRHVQERVWKDREDVKAAFRDGAKLFTCGMPGMSNEVKQKCIEMLMEHKQCGLEEATQSFEAIAKERYSTDVFG